MRGKWPRLAVGMFCLWLARPDARAADTPSQQPAPAIESIVVTGRTLTVETRIDRKSYRVSADVQSTFGTVSDVLTAIPSVDVDPDGIVSLRGDSNVVILIDGKPSTRFSGSAAGDNLQSLSAADIERIEVITTPPAEFKADGAAGVINIILRKQRPEGFAGSVQASAGSGGRGVAGANASYAAGAFTAALTAGLRHDYRARRLQSAVRATDPSGALVQTSSSVLGERIHRDVPSAGISSEYALDDRRSASGSFNWSRRGGLRTYTQSNETRTAADVPDSASERASAGHDPEFDFDEKLGFAQKLRRDGEKVDLSLHRSSSHQRERYDYADAFLLPPSAPARSNLTLLEDRAESGFDADYVLPLSKARTIKAGYAFERDDFRYGNVGNNVDPATGAQIVDPNGTHAFALRQQINAGYVNLQGSGGAWNWLAGARLERASAQAQQPAAAPDASGSTLRLYPSVHVDRSLSDTSTFSLGASRRVSRPDPSNLDPYVDHEYTPNLRAGNAGLRPQYTQSYEAGYGVEGKAVNAQLTGYYRRNKDTVTDVTQYLGNGYSLTTKTNLPRNDSAGVEFTADGHVLPTLAVSLSGNLFHSQVDASALGSPGLRSANGLNGKLKLDWRPTARDSAQLIVTRTDKRLTAQGEISAINIVNLGFKRKLRADLSAIATVSDLFNGQRYERRESTPTFSGDYQRAVQGRIVYVGLVYTFGASRKGREARLEFDPAE